ncbi:MAG TPA: alpha/beta fold hydrolase [Pyrinomonadaceae bacterium]|nr:alpha/beta fold hydrolase [Pyrinomonadaceae bacterium]
MKRALLLVFLFCLAQGAPGIRAQSNEGGNRARARYPAPVEGDYILHDFRFKNGERLPELKLHYTTLGVPVRDPNGVVRNAVLIMHGTGGAGSQFLTEQFAGVLFGEGQLLDATRYFIILPDGIGHGKSSKPSDNLHARFPHYTYDDMVAAHYQLLTKKLGVNHLRLVMGTSMGGMQTWVWGETYPDFMDALMPLASLPVEIAGRNRVLRRMILDAIRNDPAWQGGDYQTEPQEGLTSAINILLLMGSSPLQWQKQAPTRDAADHFYADRIRAQLARTDANDMLYQFDSSREYNPAPKLESIRAPLTAINSADDLINPPELGIMDREIKRVKGGRYVLIPTSDETRGHGTHSLPGIWQKYLRELLDETGR